MNTKNTMASPYQSKVRSTQNIGVPLFSYLRYRAFGKGKVFPENCNLSNLVDIQCKHENGKIDYVFLTRFILCLKNVLAIPYGFIKMFHLQQSRCHKKNVTITKIILTSISFIAFVKEWISIGFQNFRHPLSVIISSKLSTINS